MRQQTLIINGFRNLRISKRERKINKTDPLNDETKTVDPLDTSNTGWTLGLARRQEAPAQVDAQQHRINIKLK